MFGISRKYGIRRSQMAADMKAKLTSLPDFVWQELANDADRCRRNVTKQIEAILVAYFGLEDVNIGEMSDVRAAVRPHLTVKAKKETSKKRRGGEK